VEKKGGSKKEGGKKVVGKKGEVEWKGKGIKKD
jgi:hypothetical protein